MQSRAHAETKREFFLTACLCNHFGIIFFFVFVLPLPYITLTHFFCHFVKCCCCSSSRTRRARPCIRRNSDAANRQKATTAAAAAVHHCRRRRRHLWSRHWLPPARNGSPCCTRKKKQKKNFFLIAWCNWEIVESNLPWNKIFLSRMVLAHLIVSSVVGQWYVNFLNWKKNFFFDTAADYCNWKFIQHLRKINLILKFKFFRLFTKRQKQHFWVILMICLKK